MSSRTPRSQTRREPTQRSSADESRTFLNCAPRKDGQIDDLIVHADFLAWCVQVSRKILQYYSQNSDGLRQEIRVG